MGDTAEATTGSDAARKELLRRLAQDEAARKEQARRAKEETAREADPRESVQAFLTAFRASHNDIDTSLSDVPSDSGERLNSAAASIASLEQHLAQASYFLPAYEARQAGNAVAALKAKLEAARVPAADSKRFSFSRKAKVKPSGSTTAAAATSQTCACSSSPATAEEWAAASHAPPPTSTTADSSGGGGSGGGKRGCTSTAPRVVVIGAPGGGAAEDAVIEDLRDCIIHLRHSVPALQLRRLRNCQLYTAAVTGATFISDVHDCLIMLASFQVRIHSSARTDFYLRTRSKPIIEHSSALRFAPYHPCDGLGQEMQRVFGQAVNLWDQVDDFGWIKAAASPNWRVLVKDEWVAALE